MDLIGDQVKKGAFVSRVSHLPAVQGRAITRKADVLIYNLFALCTGKHEPQLAARRVIDAHIFITVLEEEAAIFGQRFASHVLGSKDAQPSAPVRRNQHGAIVVRGLVTENTSAGYESVNRNRELL